MTSGDLATECVKTKNIAKSINHLGDVHTRDTTFNNWYIVANVDVCGSEVKRWQRL